MIEFSSPGLQCSVGEYTKGIYFHTFIIIALINFHALSKLVIIIVILSQMLQIHV